MSESPSNDSQLSGAKKKSVRRRAPFLREADEVSAYFTRNEREAREEEAAKEERERAERDGNCDKRRESLSNRFERRRC